MKTSWSVDYLLTRYTPREFHEWKRTKQMEFEVKTGVPWSYSTGGASRITFRPVLKMRDVEADSNGEEQFIEAIRKTAVVMGLTSFLSISTYTGWSLLRVMSVAKSLVLKERVSLDVNRLGEPVYVKLRRSEVR